MTQIMPRMLERRKGVPLDLIFAPNSHGYKGMASIGGHIDVVYFDGKQTRVRHLEADELDQFLPHRLRYSPGSPLVHKTLWNML